MVLKLSTLLKAFVGLLVLVLLFVGAFFASRWVRNYNLKMQRLYENVAVVDSQLFKHEARLQTIEAAIATPTPRVLKVIKK